MSELEVKNVNKVFTNMSEKVEVLRDVSFTAKVGDTISIIGPSGTGKSTLLNIMGLLEPATSGSVLVEGKDLLSLDEKAKTQFRAQNVGFVFQDHHLLPQLNVIENVLLPSLINKNSDNRQAEELLDFVGLKERKNFFPWQISGGERQRVAIARGIMSGSKLLLCDEPTGNLDDENGQKIMVLLKQIAVDRNIIIIMVTHNLVYAHEFSRCFKLQGGLLKEEKASE